MGEKLTREQARRSAWEGKKKLRGFGVRGRSRGVWRLEWRGVFLSGHRRRLFRHKVAARRPLLMSPLLCHCYDASSSSSGIMPSAAMRHPSRGTRRMSAYWVLILMDLAFLLRWLAVFAKPGGTPTRGTANGASVAPLCVRLSLK